MTGRGRGSTSAFKPELFGLSNEDLKNPSRVPPPIFPPLVNKPLPLLVNDEQEYFLSVKREFREAMLASPYFIKPDPVKRDVERYSDRYADQAQAQHDAAQSAEWNFDPTRFPKELDWTRTKNKKLSHKPAVKKLKSTDDLGKTLDKLEKEEKEENEEGDSKSAIASDEEDGVNEIIDEEIYDEVEMEEGTDYGMSYFDPGEDYLDNEDDNLDDGPIY